MRFYRKSEAKALMNKWGAEHKDFLFVIDYAQEKCMVNLMEDVNPGEVLFSFPSCCNDAEVLAPKLEKIEWQISPEPTERYRQKFEKVQRYLHEGNSYLVNLTCKIPIATNLTLRDIYFHSRALYKLWIQDCFVCFSPEIFICIDEDGYIRSYPMKGTISADLPSAELRLMADRKEMAEHATVVDLIRNDLSMVAHEVGVPRYRYVDTLQTNKGRILQTSSEIQGKLSVDYLSHLGDIIFTQLPAGSITGAPKKKTQEIIAEAEDYHRGFYTGIMGVFHQGRVESGVMIRFVEQEYGQLFFKVGGGITALSQWEDEYNEIIQKAYVPIHRNR